MTLRRSDYAFDRERFYAACEIPPVKRSAKPSGCARMAS